MLVLSCHVGTGDRKMDWLISCLNGGKIQPVQSSDSTMQQTLSMSQSGVESSIQYSSIFFLFYILGAEQLHSIIPINIHLYHMGDFAQAQMLSLFEETIYYMEL